MNLDRHPREISAAADALSGAGSLWEKVRLAQRLHEALQAFEQDLEEFVKTQIGSQDASKIGRPAPPAPTVPISNGHRFANQSLAAIGKAVLAGGRELHGREIQRLALEGGYTTASTNFQDMLRVAFNRDGGFENVGRNTWRLRQGGADRAQG